jgi:hypothetical protein
MKRISLSNGKAFALVSDEDYDYLSQWKWKFAASNGYALRYFNEDGRRGTSYMHRVIMTRALGHPIPEGLQVDHIVVGEDSRLDNRRENLRLVTRSQNQWHKDTPKSNTSGFKGVTAHQGKYEAYIRVHGKRIYLGRFIHPNSAAMMFDAASRRLHREFAMPNFPDKASPAHILERLEWVLQKNGMV